MAHHFILRVMSDNCSDSLHMGTYGNNPMHSLLHSLNKIPKLMAISHEIEDDYTLKYFSDMVTDEHEAIVEYSEHQLPGASKKYPTSWGDAMEIPSFSGTILILEVLPRMAEDDPINYLKSAITVLSNGTSPCLLSPLPYTAANRWHIQQMMVADESPAYTRLAKFMIWMHIYA